MGKNLFGTIRKKLIALAVLLDFFSFALLSAIAYPLIINYEKNLQIPKDSSLVAHFSAALIISFVIAVIVSVIVALVISKKISAPISEMKNELLESEKRTREFLGSVSHDMRTPMTSIAGFVDSILDGTIPVEKQEHYLKIVSSETHRLSRLVSSMLDITRIQSGERKFNMTQFDICELLRLVLISMESQIEEKHLEIEFLPCTEKCTVLADKDAIHQVVYNLLHNAVKFTDDGGKIRVSVEKYSSGKFLVTVYNTGIGIKSGELTGIFDKFYRASSSSADKSGTGLGLFIAKTVLTAHGEKIWAESEEGKYCAISFTLAGA